MRSRAQKPREADDYIARYFTFCIAETIISYTITIFVAHDILSHFSVCMCILVGKNN